MRLRILSAAVLLTASAYAHANVIAPFQTVFNTDWSASGISGLRGLGTGNIAVAGVSGSVTSAFLYWHGPTNSTNPAANASVTLNGSAVTGTNIGFSDDNFWGFTNSQAYRANVTPLVTGNGSYTIANTIKPGVEINGASLIVFYNDGNASNNRDVVMFDGNDANFANPFDPVGWAATLSGINYSGGPASVVLGVSDGQNFTASDDTPIFLNGAPFAVPPDRFEGASLPNAGGGVSNGGLWDILSLDATPFLSVGPNTLALTTGNPVDDALSLIHLAFDLPAGSAPPPPNGAPEPGTLALVAMAIFGLATLRRRGLRA
jgi:hypothetical protein